VRPDLLYTLKTLPVDRMGTILANHDFFAGARLMRQFNNDEKSYRVAAATLLTLPGIPFIYYGEEIGLAHAEPVAGDDPAIRGPMSWSGEANAGFSSVKPFRPNVINWKTHNVAAENKQSDSLLNWYRQLIAARTAEPALSVGSFNPISAADAPVLAFTRELDGSRVLVLINYAYREASFVLPAALQGLAWKALVPTAAPVPAGTTWKLAPQQVLVLKAAP
jgi:glycosidase